MKRKKTCLAVFLSLALVFAVLPGPSSATLTDSVRAFLDAVASRDVSVSTGLIPGGVLRVMVSSDRYDRITWVGLK